MSQKSSAFSHKDIRIIDAELRASDLSRINEIFEEGFKKIIFTEKSLKGTAPKEIQAKFDPNSFYVQFALWARPEEVICIQGDQVFQDLQWRESKNKDEAIASFKDTVVPHFNQTWAHYLPQSFLDHYEDCYPLFDDKSSLIITHNDKFVATALMLEGFKNYLDEEVTQLGWIYIEPELERQKRIETQTIIAQWIKNKTNKQIQAAVHLYNERSLRCLQRMGFKIKCLSIVKK